MPEPTARYHSLSDSNLDSNRADTRRYLADCEGSPVVRETPYLRGFCTWTDLGELQKSESWLPMVLVRAPSVTLPYPA